MTERLHIVDAGVMAYRPAWDLQLQLHERVLSGEFPAGAVMLVEHPAVVTLGRRAGAEANLMVPRRLLEARGIEVVESDRGGDITFHGPGQLVAYPILNLNAYGLNLHAYMRMLEQVVIETLAGFGVTGMRDPSPKPATGVWVRVEKLEVGSQKLEEEGLAKICALGVKLRRWVTLHGLALNVMTDLAGFGLINPCGLSRPVTSMEKLLGSRCPAMGQVKGAMVAAFERNLEEQKKPADVERAPASM